MNIFYTVQGDTNINVRAASAGETAQLLGVSESEVEDAGPVAETLPGFDDDVVDTTVYDEWEKSIPAEKGGRS